jgi:uncharacterized delta-60 repeat protein
MKLLRFLLPTLLTVGAAAPALGAPGDLDATFNGTGKVTTVLAAGYSQARAIARQSDGKLLVAGIVNVPVQGNPDNLDFVVVRYDAAGMPDSSFGGTGVVITDGRGGEDDAQAVIQQMDGKIVVAGLSYDLGFNDSTITLVRYLDNGMLDSGFGGGTGKVTTAVGTGSFDGALALIQQADGKLVVAGYSDSDIAVVRYDSTGTPDSSFDTDGIVTTTVGASSVAKAIIEQASDHKLVVAGSSDSDIVLVRYGTGGTPDSMFNTTGIVTTPVGMTTAEARGLVQQSDGKLVVAGVSNDGTDDQFTLVRYTTGGVVDTAGGFGTSGIATTSVGSSGAAAFGLALQADDKLVAAGTASNGTNTDFALVRYTTAGMPDATFGSGGIVTTPIGTGDDAAAAIVYQPDGFLAVAGSTTGTQMNIAAARYVGIEGLVTTTTTSTSTTTGPGGTTTSTTLLGGALVPGGPATKTDSDCYLELLVAGAQASDVTGNKLVVCTDGAACDSGPAGDDRCDVRLAGCTLQSDGALPACTPPASLTSAKIKGKVAIDVSGFLSTPQCSPFVSASIVAKRNKRGTYLAGKSKLVLKGLAKAPKGTSPRKDADKWTIQCMPAS